MGSVQGIDRVNLRCSQDVCWKSPVVIDFLSLKIGMEGRFGTSSDEFIEQHPLEKHQILKSW